MKPQITVYDHNDVVVGTTFPRRAKHLVNKEKARWKDELHSAIILSPPLLVPSTLEGGTSEVSKEPSKDLNDLITGLFEGASQTNDITDIKEEFTITLNKKFEELLAQGMDKNEAIQKLEKETGDIQELIKGFSRKKSIIKSAYRDDVSVVMRSSPIEIIKNSKKRTRKLHTAFSAVLWSGALLTYFVVNLLILGNTTFTLNPRELSASWLIFVFAALFECCVEIYFSGKELEVLNENIDLRQINPNKVMDLDLYGYKKSLMRKIRIMTSAVIWIPLILVFFVGGYLFGNWNILWLVFALGIFFELLMHFIKTLRNK
ncbi:MAG: hypothetical protein FWC91_02735 [Defluviitaleaceae bacterium]|nr:hypothetical protein [Defluviitaleaceae bacterium]